MRAFLVTAGALVLVSVATAATPRAYTLARSTSGPIEAVAQDGHTVAWLAAGGSKCNTVHVLGPGGTQTLPQPTAGSMTCLWDMSDGPVQLAYASGSSAALWTLPETGTTSVEYVMTAQLGGPEQKLDRLAHASDGTGLWLGGLVGAGTTLAYSFADVEYVDKLGCASGGSCKKQIAGGGINLVSQGNTTPLPNAKPALELASASGRIAYVPAMRVDKTGAPAASATAPIEVVDATSGTECVAVSSPGVPLAIALSSHVLAVLARSSGTERVSWYSLRPTTGATGCLASATQLGSVAVPSTTVPQLATSDHLLVYRVGAVVRGISLGKSAARTLARTALSPLGLSLQAGRVAWAENGTSAGRIRALQLG